MSPTLLIVLCCVPSLAVATLLCSRMRPGKLAPLMRGMVVGGVATLSAGHLMQMLSFGHPGLLADWGIQGRTATAAMVALPALGYSLVAVGVGLLSGAARRSEKYDSASSAIPEVVHRVTNLEVIYRLLLESSTGATFVLSQAEAPREGNPGFTLVAGNKALKQLLEPGAFADRRNKTFGQDDPDGISWWIEETARQALASKAPVRSERGFSVRGQMRWYLLSCTSRGAYVAGSVEETTQSRRKSHERERSANTDPLTKLSNRGHLTKTIETEAHRTSHGLSPGFAVYFFDFDGFKGINDTLGHHVGDELLKSIATRLRESFRGWELPRSAGRPCIARYGGDEYVIVVPGLTQREQIESLAERFLDHLREPYSLLSHSVVSTASIGGAVGAGPGTAGHEVLAAADKAMYVAKQGGKNRFCMHDPEAETQGIAA